MVTDVTHDGSPFDVLSGVRDSIAAGTSIGEPVRTPEVTVIPMVRVSGGGGGGGGTGKAGSHDTDEQSGSGAGFGLQSRPLGAFVVRGSRVRWRPAIDVNRAILGGQILGAIALLVAGSVARQMMHRRHYLRRHREPRR